MVDYLQGWLAATQEPAAIPRGIFAGARRFLSQALEGIYLDRHERFDQQIPIMAGITNMTIALRVLHRLAWPGNPAEVEAKVRDLLDCLRDIEGKAPRMEPLVTKATSLKDFFRELQQQGNRARHADFARAESPAP